MQQLLHPIVLLCVAASGFLLAQGLPKNGKPKPRLEAFQLDALRERAQVQGGPWLSFLDRATLSAGLYRLAKGALDEQTPHALDEVYVVQKGRAELECDGRRVPAVPGSVLFVEADTEHRFVAIEEDLELLVFFSKAPPRARTDMGTGSQQDLEDR